MKNSVSVVALVLSSVLALGAAGCASGDGGASPSGDGGATSSEEEVSSQGVVVGGYIPAEITNIDEGGTFDAASLTPHSSDEISLTDLEGYWEFEGLSMEDGSTPSASDGSFTVTDKAMDLNDRRVECLPKSIDIRPFSPIQSLMKQGFGYGGAVFEDAVEEDGFGIRRIQPVGVMSYAGDGFICTIDGTTLALGLLGEDADINEYGEITDGDDNPLNKCTLTEVDYEIELEGDRLTLTHDGASATYIYRDNDTVYLFLHHSTWYAEPLYENDEQVSLLQCSPQDLLEKGFAIECDFDEMLPSCAISEVYDVTTPGGANMSVRFVNPYEKPVPLGYAEVCWYHYDGGENSHITIGQPSVTSLDHWVQEFGVTPYSDIYNHYELPYEMGKDHITYKSGFPLLSKIEAIQLLGDHYDTGEKIIESESSTEINLEFNDNILSAITISDPALFSAGLQDNMPHDDLDELEPSVYRDITERRDEILEELNKAFEAAGVDASINEKTGELVMDNNILFETGSYELGDEGKQYLDKVFKAYASVVFDEKYSPYLKGVYFEGNTDSDGSSEFNMKLSENRAKAVMEYCSGLMEDGQTAAFEELASSKGYGESDLVYDEDGKEDMAASRRVAIKFILDAESF